MSSEWETKDVREADITREEGYAARSGSFEHLRVRSPTKRDVADVIRAVAGLPEKRAERALEVLIDEEPWH